MSVHSELAVIGAGPIGILSATLAAAAGHKVGMWNPRGSDTGTYTLTCSGALETDTIVEAIKGPAELGNWPMLLIAIPGTAYHPVLSAILPHLRAGQTVIFSGALSLAQVWLHEKALQRGITLDIATWGTTLGTAHRVAPLHAHVTTVRPQLAVTALPSAGIGAMVALCQKLFGPRFEEAGAPLATLLSNINPIAHAGQVIPNLTRIEKGENWSLFANFTAAGANIAAAIDVERLAIANAFGLRLRSLADHYRVSFGVDGDSVAAIAQAIETAGKTIPGPTSISHRYIEEDVPFGLVTLQRLGTVAGIPTPMLDICVDLLGCALQRPYRDLNPILDELAIAGEDKASLMRRLNG